MTALHLKLPNKRENERIEKKMARARELIQEAIELTDYLYPVPMDLARAANAVGVAQHNYKHELRRRRDVWRQIEREKAS